MGPIIQVLAHPWIVGEVSDRNLGDAYANRINLMTCRRVLKRGTERES
jgi:hypothetical protein